jgi:chorismate--pyruvate lyase
LSRRPIDRQLAAWLRSDGSLSRRLTRAFGGFQVQVLSQGTAVATANELRVLRGAGGRRRVQRCHVREVILWGDGQPLVHARSVLPAVSSRLTWRALRGLGSRPLADLLFGAHAARCERLGHAPMQPWPARRLAQRLAGASEGGWPAGPLWSRRSVFFRRGVPLLLTEWFSPAVRQRSPSDSE